MTPKLVIGLLLFVRCAYGQTTVLPNLPNPTFSIVPGKIQIPDESVLDTESPSRMPTLRPSNSFYRNPRDLPNVVRASLDNMPVKMPDTTVYYTMLQSYRRPFKLDDPAKKSSLPSVPKSYKITPKPEPDR